MYIPFNRDVLPADSNHEGAERIPVSKAQWIYRTVKLEYPEIVRRGMVRWCTDNVVGHWTLKEPTVFGFERDADAMMFTIYFGV